MKLGNTFHPINYNQVPIKRENISNKPNFKGVMNQEGLRTLNELCEKNSVFKKIKKYVNTTGKELVEALPLDVKVNIHFNSSDYGVKNCFRIKYTHQHNEHGREFRWADKDKYAFDIPSKYGLFKLKRFKAQFEDVIKAIKEDFEVAANNNKNLKNDQYNRDVRQALEEIDGKYNKIDDEINKALE